MYARNCSVGIPRSISNCSVGIPRSLSFNMHHFVPHTFVPHTVCTTTFLHWVGSDRLEAAFSFFFLCCKGSTGERAFFVHAVIVVWIWFERRACCGCARLESRDLSEKRVLPLDKSLSFCALILTRCRLAAPPEGSMKSRSLSRTALHKAASANSLCGPRF